MATGGLFNRLKIWVFEEVLKSKDLNAEFDNIINHFNPLYLSSFEQTILQMQNQLSPGDVGTEVLAASLSQEIAQIRFAIARITGLPFWYQQPVLSIATINTLLRLGVSIPNNRIISGRTRAQSSQSDFLLAAGSSPMVTLEAGGGNPSFNVEIQNVQYTFNSNIVFAGMSLAPSTQNTATVNDASIVNDPYVGETDASNITITISGAGTNITSKVGQFAAFKVIDGGKTEYFIGYLNSSTQIINCFRGYFTDSTDTPIKRTPINNGDTLSVMMLTWLFVTTTGTLDVTYNTPKYSAVTPTSPSSGDYWFNINTQIWMKFTGGGFVNSNATYVGICIQDTTGTVGTRSGDFFAVMADTNTIIPSEVSATTVSSIQAYSSISVYGQTFNYGPNLLMWNNPAQLDTGVTIAASTPYYFYVSDIGKPIISDQKPYQRLFDLYGQYHPYQNWRAVCSVLTDGGGNFQGSPFLLTYGQEDGNQIRDKTIGQLKLSPRIVSSTVAPIGGVMETPSCGAFSISGASGGVTNLTGTIITTGRPVVAFLMSDLIASDCDINVNGPGGNARVWINFSGATTINNFRYVISAPTGSINMFPVNLGLYALNPGSNGFAVEAQADPGITLAINNLRLVIYEI